MSNRLFIAVASFTISAYVTSAQLVAWRFTSLQRHGDGVLTTRDVLKLEFVTNVSYIADNDLTWTAPTCSLTEQTGQVTFLKCQRSGIHSVDLDVKGVGNKTRMIKFITTYECYNWYISIRHNEETHMSDNITTEETESEAHSKHQLLKVWVVDDLQASDSELNDTATTPSTISRQLTIEYHLLGQTPTVSRTSWLNSGTFKQWAALKSFEKVEGYWLFELAAPNEHSHVRAPHYTITGMPVALYDCFIKKRVVVYQHIKYPLLSLDTPQYYMTGRDTHSLTLIQDPCHASLATVIVHNKVYITQDDFASITLLPAPEDLHSNLDIIAIAMMFNYIVVLSANNSLYYLGIGSSQFKYYQVPESIKPTSISSQSWCIEGLYNNVPLDLLTMTDGTDVWVSNNLETPVKLTLPLERLEELALGRPYQYAVKYISMDIHPGRIGIAITLAIGGSKKVVFAIHDYLLKTWELAPFWVDFKSMNIGKISFYFLGLAKSSFYFRNERNLFYSYDNSERYGLKHIYGCGNLTQLVDDMDYIKDAIVSKQGDISLFLNTNQILFGRVKQKELVLFDVFNSPLDVNTIHWYDDLNQLWFIKVYANNSVEKVKYPTMYELQAAIGFGESCPYRYFLHSVQVQVYLLDKQEEYKFWAFLAYKQSRQNSLDILYFDSHDVIEYTSSTEKKYIAGVASVNLTITFTHKRTAYSSRIADASNTNTSVAILELRPRRTNLLCQAPNSAVAYMSVGCPSERKLRVQLPEGEECSGNVSALYPNGYLIPAGLWANLTTGQTVNRDKFILVNEELGCPITVRNGQTFRPVLQLYDFNKFVKVVEADFILWEMNGQVDYTYTHSIEQIQCLREAQSWTHMRELANYSLSPDKDLWGPHNYQSCYTSESEGAFFIAHMHDVKYEILNYSSPNRITFNHDYESLHIFRVRVVDPYYSFCNLSATFAVRIEGIVVPGDLRDIAAANYAVLAAIVLALMATYIWFHRHTVGKQSQLVEDKSESM